MESLDISEIKFISENNDRSFKNYIYKTLYKNYKTNKITSDEYKEIGGKISEDKPDTIKVFSNAEYQYDHNVICIRCKNRENIPNTPNTKGICLYLSTSNNSLFINVKCERCKCNKNSFIKKNTLSPDIQKVVDNRIQKHKEKIAQKKK